MWIVVVLVVLAALLLPFLLLAALDWLSRMAGTPLADAAAHALVASQAGSPWMAASAAITGVTLTVLGLAYAVRWWRSLGRAPVLGLYSGMAATGRYLAVVSLLTVGGAILGSSVARLLGGDPSSPSFWLPGIAGPLLIAPAVATGVLTWWRARRAAT